MPDITMCNNYDCELKNNCYRFKAKPDYFKQSYQRFEPKFDEALDEIECDFYIKKRENEELWYNKRLKQ